MIWPWRRRRASRTGTASLVAMMMSVALVCVAEPDAIAETSSTTDQREIAVVGPPGDRLTNELIRELVTARFDVRRFDASPRASVEALLRLVPVDIIHGVMVGADSRRVFVFARDSAQKAPLHTRIELALDPHDRLSRRRACLTVVEYLRVVVAADRQPVADDQPRLGASEQPAAPEPPRPTRSPRPIGTAAATPTAPALVLDEEEWERAMGVAPTIDINAGIGQSTTEMQFIWRAAVRPRWTAGLRAGWPLLGASGTNEGAMVRLWTFSVGGDIELALADQSATVRPFVGLTLAWRLMLIDVRTPGLPASDTAVTSSLTAGVLAGLAYRLSPDVHLFLESGVARGWHLPWLDENGYAVSAASALCFRTSAGVMFDYWTDY